MNGFFDLNLDDVVAVSGPSRLRHDPPRRQVRYRGPGRRFHPPRILQGLRRPKRPSTAGRIVWHGATEGACDWCGETGAWHRLTETGVAGAPRTARLCCDCFGSLFGLSVMEQRGCEGGGEVKGE